MNYIKLIRSFGKEILKQFKANEVKYPDPAWPGLSNKELINELYYHVGKLQAAEKAGNLEHMKEHCGDLGAISIMFLDNNKILHND